MPWWAIVLCILGGVCIGAVAMYFGLMLYLSKGFQW